MDEPAAGTSHSHTSTTPEREPSALTLAAVAAVAVPGLDPARLALPQDAAAAQRLSLKKK